MWEFILGLIIGSNISIIIYALIIVGKESEIDDGR